MADHYQTVWHIWSPFWSEDKQKVGRTKKKPFRFCVWPSLSLFNVVSQRNNSRIYSHFPFQWNVTRACTRRLPVPTKAQSELLQLIPGGLNYDHISLVSVKHRWRPDSLELYLVKNSSSFDTFMLIQRLFFHLHWQSAKYYVKWTRVLKGSFIIHSY